MPVISSLRSKEMPLRWGERLVDLRVDVLRPEDLRLVDLRVVFLRELLFREELLFFRAMDLDIG